MVKNRKRWLDVLFSQYWRLLDEHGLNSPLAVACVRWSERDPQAHKLLVGARLVRLVFGSGPLPKCRYKSNGSTKTRTNGR